MQTITLSNKWLDEEVTGNELNRIVICWNDGSDTYMDDYNDMLTAVKSEYMEAYVDNGIGLKPSQVIRKYSENSGLNGNNSKLIYFHIDMGAVQLLLY